MNDIRDRTGEHNPDRTPNPAQKQEKVEDRPNVSTVTPDDYPDRSKDTGKLSE